MSGIPSVTIDRVLANFEVLDEWMDRYRYIIDLGRQVPEMPPEEKTDANKVQGCQSSVWITARVRDGAQEVLLDFNADSDAHIVKGLVAVLLIVFGGRRAKDIQSFDIEGLFKKLELDEHLSPTRSNGLHQMVKRIRELAGQVQQKRRA